MTVTKVTVTKGTRKTGGVTKSATLQKELNVKKMLMVMALVGVMSGFLPMGAMADCPEGMRVETISGKLLYYSNDEDTMGTDYSLEDANKVRWMLFPVGPYFGDADYDDLAGHYTRGAKINAVMTPFVDKNIRVTGCAYSDANAGVIEKISSIE